MENKIDHPQHYKIGPFEVMFIIEEACKKAESLPPRQIYHFATCIKYLLRSPFKGHLYSDLKKCRFHLNRWIEILEDKSCQ